jgi:hypothetical protein
MINGMTVHHEDRHKAMRNALANRDKPECFRVNGLILDTFLVVVNDRLP